MLSKGIIALYRNLDNILDLKKINKCHYFKVKWEVIY